MTPRKRKRRDPQRDAFVRVVDDRVRSYVNGLGGIRSAAEAAGLSPGTLSGWFRAKRPSLRDALSLLQLSDLKDQSLDWLVGRDVPETWTATRTRRTLAEEVMQHAHAHLASLGVAWQEKSHVFLPEDADELLIHVEKLIVQSVRRRRDVPRPTRGSAAASKPKATSGG